MPNPPRLAQRLPFLTRLSLFVRLIALKALVNVYVFYRTRFQRVSSGQATYTKTYPVRPSITNRVFIPKSYTPGSAALPLIIDIHGGGFAIGAPVLDDADNLILANQHGFLVVSIGYSLAPRNPFPAAVHDVAALINAVLEDTSLPFDKSRVAVAGYSAGANLALAAAQMDGLAKRLCAVVAYYAPLDFTRPSALKLKTATPPPGGTDKLKYLSAMFNWGYVSPGQDLEDPLLSPIFARRESLPEHLYFLGCQYDMLCKEAEEMAARMAESEGGERRVLEDDGGQSWERGGVRWRNIHGVLHGFNQQPLPSGEKQRICKRKTEDMHASIAAWLREKAFSAKSKL